MLHAKIAQRVIVHVDATQQPQIGDLVLAPPIQLASTPNPVQGGLQPQRHQNLRRDRRSSCRVGLHLDVTVKWLQVEGAHKRPHAACPIIGGQQLVDRIAVHLDLRPMRPAHAGRLGSVFCIHAAVLAPCRMTSKARRNFSQPLRESCKLSPESRGTIERRRGRRRYE